MACSFLFFSKELAEGQDCYNQILSGINNVIRTHINEIHTKFESQFSSMAVEVEKRDALIAHLQAKLKSLELNVSSTSLSRRKSNREKNASQCSEDGMVDEAEDSSSGSSAELLFMVGL